MSTENNTTLKPLTFIERLTASENHQGYDILTSDDWVIGSVMPIDEEGIAGLAYARLFSAAPELLEALERVAAAKPDRLDHSRDVAIIERASSVARAAIAKATQPDQG